MPKKGYKQSPEHRAKIGAARAEPRKKRPVEKKPPVFRDYKCATYHKCLANAARFDLVLDCTDCPNRRHKIPKSSDIYFEILTEDALRCCELMKAVFRPEIWEAEQRERKEIGGDDGRGEAFTIDWWG